MSEAGYVELPINVRLQPPAESVRRELFLGSCAL